MASGDTKTNQYLDIAANGTRADLPSDTCCETRTQTLIRGVAERIMDVEDEVEGLKNNPDVVDIVDTYADLQAYSTSGLTDKDIIRVITDETKGGLSSYYRWNSPNPGWNFVGVIPGGDGIKELSSADYNYPTANPDRVALWLLDNGLYTAPAGVMVAASTTSYPWYNTSDKTILVGGSDTVKGIYTFLNGKTDVVTTQVSDGTEADEYTLLKSTQVLQATGQSTTDTMSQKAITDALASAGGAKELTTADYDYPVNSPNSIAAWALDNGWYTAPGCLVRVNSSVGVGLDSGSLFYVKKGSGSGSASRIVVFGYDNTVKVYSTDAVSGSEYSSTTQTVALAGSAGNSTSSVMTQNAVTSMVFADPTERYKIQLGKRAVNYGAYSVAIGSSVSSGATIGPSSISAVAIGPSANVDAHSGIGLGAETSVTANGGVAIGRGATASLQGQFDIGANSQTSYGYGSTAYRLLSGVYDGQNAHDAVTVGQVNSVIDAINTALSTNVPHIGA